MDQHFQMMRCHLKARARTQCGGRGFFGEVLRGKELQKWAAVERSPPGFGGSKLGAASLRRRRIQTALFLVLKRTRQHVGRHERQAIDALVCQESGYFLLQALGPVYSPQ